MLSRVAERIYWLSRYAERAENTARLISVYSTLMLDVPRGTRVGWHTLTAITGCHEQFEQRYKEAEERNVMRFLLVDTSNPAAIMHSLEHARENARSTREIIPSEAWELLNNLYHYGKEQSGKAVSRKGRHPFLQEVIAHVQQFTGLLAGTMSHNDAYDFMRLGRNLERADMTTRIVDVGASSILPALAERIDDEEALEPFSDILWMSVLTSLSAYQMYRQHVRDRVNAEDVALFLLQDEQFPRSVASCLSVLEVCLQSLPRSDDVLRSVAGMRRLIKETKMNELPKDRLHEFIDQLQQEIATIHNQIAETWFLPVALSA